VPRRLAPVLGLLASACLAAAVPAVSASAGAATFYVSPAGSDTASGTSPA
jgi:hypothetical protein